MLGESVQPDALKLFDGERGAQIKDEEQCVVERLWNRHVWCQHTTDSFVLSILDESLGCLSRWICAPAAPDHNRHNLIEPEDMAWIRKANCDIVASGADRKLGQARDKFQS